MSDNPEGSAPENRDGGDAEPNPESAQPSPEIGGWPTVPSEWLRPQGPPDGPPEPIPPLPGWPLGSGARAAEEAGRTALTNAAGSAAGDAPREGLPAPDPWAAPAVPSPRGAAPDPWPDPINPTPAEKAPEPWPAPAAHAHDEPAPQTHEDTAVNATGHEPSDVDEYADWTPGPHDLIPLLPRGTVIFEGIPSEAVVIAALAPAIVHGAVVVRKPEAVGVVLVKDGALFEEYAFQGEAKLFGEAALNLMSGWADATVAAYLFDPLIVDVAPSLFRGNPCYQDLRLSWTDWPGLLADLCSRPGSHVVELDTPLGRGVTLILDGRQVATYTESHPELGESTLLDPLAATRKGTIWVRREPNGAEESSAEFVPPPPAAAETSDPQGSPDPPGPARGGIDWSAPPPWTAAETQQLYTDPFETSAAMPPDAPPKARWGAPPPSIFEPEVQTPASPIATMAPELKRVARERLQRSSPRVEAMIDEAVARNLPLDGLLVQIRGLVIRGIMQSTLDEVVADMAAVAGSPPV